MPMVSDEQGGGVAIGEGKNVPGVGEPLVSKHCREHGCSIHRVEGVRAVEVECDVLSGVSLNGRLHTLHRPLRAAGGVQGELDGLEHVGMVAFVHVVAELGRQLEEELPHGQGAQGVRARLGDAQQEGGGQQAAAVGVELVVGNELDEQSTAIKAGVVLQQWLKQLCSPS